MLSTKTATLALSRNARTNPDTQNLDTLPELLLLSGGMPLNIQVATVFFALTLLPTGSGYFLTYCRL